MGIFHSCQDIQRIKKKDKKNIYIANSETG